VLVVVTTVMMWVRQRRPFWLLCGAILLLWIGLAQTFSQSSFIALLAGLAVLAALRWSWRWTLGVVVVGVVGASLVVILIGGKGFDLGRINLDTSGRAHLVSGGPNCSPNGRCGDTARGPSRRRTKTTSKAARAPVTISHTEPITVASEQGLIGLAAYVALIVVSLWTMAAGLWARAPGRDPPHVLIARAAVLAAFVALLVHTMAYAGFFEDPITWVLMAVGASLAASHRRISAS